MLNSRNNKMIPCGSTKNKNKPQTKSIEELNYNGMKKVIYYYWYTYYLGIYLCKTQLFNQLNS